MISVYDICEEEWAEWYQLTPVERWKESEMLWSTYLDLGGSLDPQPDTQSPFNDTFISSPVSLDGRPSVRVLRRSGV